MMLPWRHSSAIAAEVESVLEEARVRERRGLGIRRGGSQTCIRMGQNVQALRVRGHQSVLDAVRGPFSRSGPRHAGRSADSPCCGRGTRGPATCGSDACCRGHAVAWRKRRQRRLHERDRLRVATDHQAVPLLETEHAAARADVEVVNARRLEPAARWMSS